MRRIFTTILFISAFCLAYSQPLILKGSYQEINRNLIHPVQSKLNSNPVSLQMSPITIGTTTYDLQTNASMSNNVFLFGNQVSVAWNHSQNLIPGGSFVLNAYNDGTAWLPQTDTTGLSDTNWPNIVRDGFNNEYMFVKKGTGYPKLLSRTAGGTGGWTVANAPPSAYDANWPRMAISGTSLHCLSRTDDAYVLNGVTGNLVYHRSDDLGATWSMIDILLPGIDSTRYLNIPADHYSMDARGSVIAIVQGGFTNDLALWKSTDNGNTWIKTIIWSFPAIGVGPYNESLQITDVDGDGVSDTISTYDGALEVLIDDNNMVHCWTGRMRINDDDPAGPIGYFPTTDGLYYWNESFNMASPVIITGCVDIDSNGIIDVVDVPGYNGRSICSMPTAALDTSGTIFLAYSAVVEWTSNGGTPDYPYRNVYMMYSEDHGLTWTYPTNISQSDFDEAVFPSLARDANGWAHLVYQQDGDPGLSEYGDHVIGVNEIIYQKLNKFDITPVFSPPIISNFTISGKTYWDINSNGIFDSGIDTILPNQQIKILPLNAFVNSFNTGNYIAQLPAGNYLLECVIPNGWSQTSTPVSYNINLTGPPITGIDFGLEPATPIDSVAVGISSGNPRCNSNVTYRLSATNYSSQMRDFIVYLNPDQLNLFVSSNPNPSSFNGTEYEWNFTQVLPFETKSIGSYLFLPGAGNVIVDSAFVELYNSGTLLKSDSIDLSRLVACAWDPNTKAVTPQGVGPQYLTPIYSQFQYTINFQNTGNDTAFKVVIKDLIDADLDLSTLSVLGASHDYTWQLVGRELQIIFENILLPDSNVNEPMSHGFVSYKIFPLPGVPEMTLIENTAHIFFDYNSAVITNTVENLLSSTVGINEVFNNVIQLTVYPSLSDGSIRYFFNSEMNNKYRIQITDVSGRLLIVIPNALNGQEINLEHSNSGVYFIRLINETTGGMDVEKVIVY